MKTFTATLTPTGGSRDVFVARVHEAADPRYGDPWTWGCVVERRRPGFWRRAWLRLSGRPVPVTAFLHAALTAPTPAEAEALRRKLVAAGYTRRAYERWKGGKRRVYERPL